MTKNWIAVNVVLILITGLLGWQLYVSTKRFSAENTLARIQPVQDLKKKITLDGGLPPLKPGRPYNAAEFAVIPAQNLFSDTRAEERTEAPAVAETPALQQKPVLIGVTIMGARREAMIVDTTASNAPGRRSQTKRLGDTYQGYTVTDITEDRMVLELNERREIIPLYDSSKRPSAGKTPILATRVVNFGGAGGAGSAVVTSGRAPVASPASTAGRSSGRNAGPAGASPQSVPVQGRQTIPSVQPSIQSPIGIDSQGRRVLRTPFGDIVQPPQPPQAPPPRL